LEIEALGVMAGGEPAVKDDPRPDQIALGEIAGKESGAIAEMDMPRSETGLANLGQHLPEKALLRGGEGVVLLVGNGQVGDDALHAQAWKGGQLCEDLRELFRAKADPAHAGIDLEVIGTASAAGARLAVEAMRHLQVEKTGGKGVSEDLFFLTGINTAQDENGTLDADPAQFQSFLDHGHAEKIGAGLLQYRGDAGGAMPVSIGLDHGQNRALGTGLLLGLQEIVPQGVQIDFDMGGAMAVHLLNPLFAESANRSACQETLSHRAEFLSASKLREMMGKRSKAYT
jgi:hypothetical protein